MQISIWRQYASNHSADFTIVGAFPTQADADRAAAELRAILAEVYTARAPLVEDALRQEVERRAAERPDALSATDAAAAVAGRWDEALGDDAAAVRAAAEEAIWRHPPVTEAEQALAELYEVAWPVQGLDWLPRTLEEAEAEIRQIGTLILIGASGNTFWSGPLPFSSLILRLGGQLKLDSENAGEVEGTVFVSCTAPDEPTARQLEKDRFRQALDRINATGGRAWQVSGEAERRGRALTFRLRYWSPETLPTMAALLTEAGCAGLSYGLEPGAGGWRYSWGALQARALKQREVDAAAALIHDLNARPEQRCLDCPDDLDAIRAALGAPDALVVVAVDGHDTLFGALVVTGAEKLRRLWGPYVLGRPWPPVASLLLRRVPHHLRLTAVYGPENWRCAQLLDESGLRAP